MTALSIALISPLNQTTPPATYGGVERVVAIHAAELARLGHRVVVFAAAGSAQPGVRSVAFGPVGIWPGPSQLLRLGLARLRHAGFQIVHSFARSITLLPWLPFSSARLVQTYACPLSAATIRGLDRLLPGRISYTVPSHWMERAFPPTYSPLAMVPNSLPQELYQPRFSLAADAPLAFLGRFDPSKGLHEAIAVAVAAGRPIDIGGAAFDAPSHAYAAELQRRWQGHPLVRFLGPLDDQGKQDLLARAAALLFPIGWEEPFGLVMIEAMACGTPVLAYARGAVPEIVQSGRNGFVVADQAAMTEAVARLGEIDRRAVWRSFQERYAAPAVTAAYMSHYRRVFRLAQQESASR
ncbi:glycosyltransferase [Synechococcus sp. CS-1329]|uniref:glycosyltransferase n=1 Tax=Synechococcus sp. CS-1329 TaxID=2847975 RepID=UPI00223BB138|nr:glycosyltransferase [Synechococcus sp. CS-1329]MCT0219811.1 glycosyltransferase [Synechococcus sp. CS-1329]